MIQELFGGGAALLGGGAGERKISFSDILEGSPSPSPSPSFSSSCTNTITSNGGGGGVGVGGGCNTTTPTTTTDQQNLRCPRCDSSNTKFCYYNNYNLTQPRHFCKTCRRYWTKGGALRNVPIGGGCRKNKNSCTSPATATVKSSAGKIKTGSGEFGKSNFGFDLDPPPSSNPILWNSQPSSQLMALLRATQNQNPNPNPSSVGIKEETTTPMIGSYNMMTTTTSDSTLGTTGALNARSIGVDPLGQVPVGLCNSFWRNNQHQQPQQQQQQQQHHHNNLLMGDAQAATGIQELFQRLRSSGNYYSDHHSQSASLFSNNVIQSSSASPTIMEPSPITAAEVGYWNNPNFSWSNLSTANGAFP